VLAARGDSGGAVTVLKRLLRRNPKNPLGLERRRQAQGAASALASDALNFFSQWQ